MINWFATKGNVWRRNRHKKAVFLGCLFAGTVVTAAGAVLESKAELVYAADTTGEIFEEKTYTLTIYPEIVESFPIVETPAQPDLDYDGSFESTANGNGIWAKGEKGYYVRYNEYVYFCSFDAQLLVPLCNRPECLHNEETKDELKKECHAYVGHSHFWNMLQYYDGKLYANTAKVEFTQGVPMALDKDYFSGDEFYVLADDGSTKDLLDVRVANPEISHFHRGRLFYVSHVDDHESGLAHYEIGYQSLDGKEQKTIAAVDGTYTLFYCYPYGDYLYFDVQTNLIMEEDVDYSCIYDWKNDQIMMMERKSCEENGPFLPDGEDFIKMPEPGKLLWFDKEGQKTGKTLELIKEDGTSFGLPKTPEGWGWYLAMDENYYYSLEKDKDKEIGSVVVVYDRETGETVQYLKTQMDEDTKFGILEQRIGVTDDYLFFGTYYPVWEPNIVYWMKKEDMLKPGAQFEELRP